MKLLPFTALNFNFIVIILPLILLLNIVSYGKSDESSSSSIPKNDIDLLEFPLNLEYLEAEFFLWGSTGSGLDKIAPDLAEGGPPPSGAKKASLDPFTNDVIYQFALQEVGHLRAIKKRVKGFPRPTLNLSNTQFAAVMNSAFEQPLWPPFDPYQSPVNYLLASYLIPYVGLTGYVGASPKLSSSNAKKLVAGLLAVESGQDAVIRTMLYQRRFETVIPYGITVQEFTNRVSKLRNKLGKSTKPKDEGLYVNPSKGAEGKVRGNILVGNKDSLGFPRTPQEILRIVYSTGDEKKFGGFYPKGAAGSIAQSYLPSNNSTIN